VEKLKKEPKRILHVVSAMNRGGAETLLMNVYRTLDRDKVQFDFVTHRQEICDYDLEIVSMGGKIFRISSLGELGPSSYIKTLRDIIKNGFYKAVHSHTDYQAGFSALAARLAGVNKRVCHAHTNKWLDSYTLKQQFTLKGYKL
jgi:glycosyltransferase EpsF